MQDKNLSLEPRVSFAQMCVASREFQGLMWPLAFALSQGVLDLTFPKGLIRVAKEGLC